MAVPFWHFGIGAVIVVLARPFEGSVLLVVALLGLAAANRSLRVWLPIVLIGVVGASWLEYDNYRVTGHPLRLPYHQYYLQYETVPPFWFMPTSTPSKSFRHFDLESRTLDTYERARSWRPLVDRPEAWFVLLSGYYGNVIWLLPLAAGTSFLWRSRRIRFTVILTLAIVAVSFLEVWWYPHYAAPFTAALLILAAQARCATSDSGNTTGEKWAILWYCNGDCRPGAHGGNSSPGDREAPNRGSNSRTEHTKGNGGARVARDASGASCHLCSLHRPQPAS